MKRKLSVKLFTWWREIFSYQSMHIFVIFKSKPISLMMRNEPQPLPLSMKNDDFQDKLCMRHSAQAYISSSISCNKQRHFLYFLSLWDATTTATKNRLKIMGEKMRKSQLCRLFQRKVKVLIGKTKVLNALNILRLRILKLNFISICSCNYHISTCLFNFFVLLCVCVCEFLFSLVHS